MFEKRIPRELRRAYEVGRVQLVLVEGVVSEHLEHVGQQTDIAQEVELHVILEALTLKVRKILLGVAVVCLRTLQGSELVEDSLSRRYSGYIELRERVHEVVAEDAFPLEKFHIRPWVNIRDHLLQIV